MLYRAVLASFVVVTALAHPGHFHTASSVPRLVSRQEAPFSAAKFPDVQKALEGNQRFVESRGALFDQLVTDGQKPPFAIYACSDSRAPPETIFDSDAGTWFTQRNIANQYKPGDENAQSVMAYGITVLGVQHLVVLGHYGCGGVAAAIASAPKKKIDVATHIVQTWIGDIRSLYLQSNRTEIVAMREANLAIEAEGGTVGEPELQDPGFRALVEENVKQQVKRLTDSSVIANLNERLAAEGVAGQRKRAEEGAPLIPVFVHGWVHDLETGTVVDLNVSTGPPGFENFVPGAGVPEDGNIVDTPVETPVETTSVEAPVGATSVETPVESTPVGSAPVPTRTADDDDNDDDNDNDNDDEDNEDDEDDREDRRVRRAASLPRIARRTPIWGGSRRV